MTETVTVEVVREVLIPIPSGLTEQVEVPAMPDTFDTIGLGALYKLTRTRLMIANGKLKAIEELVKELTRGDGI